MHAVGAVHERRQGPRQRGGLLEALDGDGEDRGGAGDDGRVRLEQVLPLIEAGINRGRREGGAGDDGRVRLEQVLPPVCHS